MQQKKRLIIVAVAATVTVAAILAAILIVMRPVRQADIVPPLLTSNEVAELGIREESFTLPPPEPMPTGEYGPPAPEVVRQPYLPPPSMNLTSSRLGTQRVPGSEDVGDVYQILFHARASALFMAVIEPTGLRAIWKLDQHGAFERVFAVSEAQGEIRLFMTSGGVMYVQAHGVKGMLRTDDAFATIHQVDGDFGMFWQMTDNGRGTVWGTQHEFNSAVLFRSTDNGLTWEPWVDFHQLLPQEARRYAQGDERFRLRHLHGIIFNDKTQELVVGTGDVARYALRTRDEGFTWEQIWDEGFTAWAPVPGGSRYVLGPDKLAGPGIVLYDAWADTVRTVWTPWKHGYAGYTYSIISAEGILYAAFHTEANEVEERTPLFGIVVSPDAETWYPFLQWGPLGNHARTDIWLAPSPSAIYASVNGALYAFSPLDQEWFTNKTPFME